MQEMQITQAQDGMRLTRWLKTARPDMPFGLVQKLLRKGAIRVDGQRVKKDQKLQSGQCVQLPDVEQRETESRDVQPGMNGTQAMRALTPMIIFENKHFIALNKPAGLAVQGGSGVRHSVDRIIWGAAQEMGPLKLTHRLDKDTSGVLLLARSRLAAEAATKAFKAREFTKIYQALLVGVPQPQEGTWKEKLAIAGESGRNEKTMVDAENGQRAITHYRVMDKAGKVVSLVELTPESGRKHQLRVHAAHHNVPIVGDGKYGGKEAFITGVPNQMMLHAAQLTHNQLLGEKLQLEAPLPPHMAEARNVLGF